MAVSLFGVTETRAEARTRARTIAEHCATLAEAPEAIETRQSQVVQVQYFIDRSNACALDENDLDALMHEIDTSECLEDGDLDEMHANAAIWRDYMPGWGGAQPGDKYPAQLHRKEIEYLTEVRDQCAEEAVTIQQNADAVRAELDTLRAVGPLYPDDAKRHNLTVEGFPLCLDTPAQVQHCTQPAPTIADLNAAIRQARAIVAKTGAVAVIIKNESGYAALHEPDYHFGHNPAGIVARVFSQTEIVVYACPVSPDPEAAAREDTDAAAPRAEVCDTWSEPAALRRSFGTRPAAPLKPARKEKNNGWI